MRNRQPQAWFEYSVYKSNESERKRYCVQQSVIGEYVVICLPAKVRLFAVMFTYVEGGC